MQEKEILINAKVVNIKDFRTTRGQRVFSLVVEHSPKERLHRPVKVHLKVDDEQLKDELIEVLQNDSFATFEIEKKSKVEKLGDIHINVEENKVIDFKNVIG